MTEFHFHPELFEARGRLLQALTEEDVHWFSDYSSIDVLHEEEGLEVSSIAELGTAIRIGWIMVRLFPEWEFGAVFLKDWGRCDLGWKVIIARRPDCEGPGYRDDEGVHRSFPLRDMLRWAEKQLRSGQVPEARAEGEAEGSQPDDAAGRPPAVKPLEEQPEADEALAQLAALFGDLEQDDDEPLVLDRAGVEAEVARTEDRDSGLGAWVASAFVEFVALGGEPIDRCSQAHLDGVGSALRYCASLLCEVGVVGRWEPLTGIIRMSESTVESAYTASIAVERVLKGLQHALLIGDKEVFSGAEVRITLAFSTTASMPGSVHDEAG